MLRSERSGQAGGFADMEMLARVEATLAAGTRLPRWGWPKPAPYNGASGDERIAGWQYLHIAVANGWMFRPTCCSLCPGTERLHMHTENYFRPLVVRPVCQRCHFCLHRRFRHPASWLALVDTTSAEWAKTIDLREQTRNEARDRARLPMG